MKKTIAILSIAIMALTLTISPALAKNDGNKEDKGEHKGLQLGKLIRNFGNRFDRKVTSDKFVLTGTISGISGTTLTVTVKTQIHIPTVINNQVTITDNADTKYTRDKNETISLADLKIGNQVVIVGTVSGSTLTATRVHVLMPAGKAYGEVTAKTDTSITVKNNVTGVTQTFTTSEDTKVKIDGEVKTVADVQVGDKGVVKFKTKVAGLFAKMVNLFR